MDNPFNNTHLLAMINDFPAMKLTGGTRTWVMLCPFHWDRRERPEFFVDIQRKHYRCLGCGVQGNLDELQRKLKEKEAGDLKVERKVVS